MKAKELRSREPAELTEELLKLRREQFNLRMARATGQPPKPDQWQRVRRSIARLKTVLGEKRTGKTPVTAVEGNADSRRAASVARPKARIRSVKQAKG